MSLLTLPYELICMITEEFQSIRDIFSLILTNSYLAYTLIPHLHKRALEDADGMTALQWAAENGHESLVRILLKQDVDVDFYIENCPDTYTNLEYPKSQTALYRAVDAGNRVIVELLLSHGALADIGDRDGFSPLHAAIRDRDEHIVKLLLEYGADIEGDWLPDSPLSLAVRTSSDAIVRLLLEKGADISYEDIDGETLLHLAVIQGSEPVVDMLIEQGASVNWVNSKGLSILHQAASWGNERSVEIMLRRGLKVDSTDYKGYTALHHAVSGQERNSVVRTLLEWGADVTHKGYSGKAVIDRTRPGYWPCVEIRRLLFRGVAFRRWRNGRIVFLG